MPGWPQSGSVRLAFVYGTVRALPVLSADSSSGESVFLHYRFSRKVWFWFQFRLPDKRFRRFRCLVSGSVPGHHVMSSKERVKTDQDLGEIYRARQNTNPP